MASDLPVPHDTALPYSSGQETGPQWAGGPPEEPTRGKGFAEYLNAIERFKWLAIALTVLGTIGGVVATRFVKPQYSADVTIWIQAGGLQANGPIQTTNLLDATAWLDLMRSFSVLDSVVMRTRLYLDQKPADTKALKDFQIAERFRPGKYRLTVDKNGRTFDLKTAEGATVERGNVGNPIGQKVGFKWQPAKEALGKDRTIEFELTSPRDASRDLRTDLKISTTKNESFLKVEYTGEERVLVGRVVNGVADRFLEAATELKRARLKELVGLLEQQRITAEQNLREAEYALERYRIETITLPSDQATPVAPGLTSTQGQVMSNFFQMKIEQEQVRRDAEVINRILAEAAKSPATITDLGGITSVQQSPELSQALAELVARRATLRTTLQQYTPEHRNAKLLTAEIEKYEREILPRLTRGLLTQIGAKTNLLEERIASAGSELREIPPRIFEEGRLARQVAIATELHTNLRTRYESAQLATATTVADVQILDRAKTPHEPLKKVGITLLLMGFFGGLGLGVGLCILLDVMDPRVRYPQQISQGMGLPIHGVLPNLKAKSGHAADLRSAHALEALREVRHNISHYFTPGSPIIFTVSSPGSGDGKTFITCNLAMAFADSGYRTVVIDGDTRRSTLHRLLDMPRRPGLTDYLSGDADYRQVVKLTAFDRLHFISSGSQLQSAPNLLGGSTMTELMSSLRQEYDVIIFDSPPLAAGVDPFILATVTGNLLVVLRSGQTDRALAEAKLEAMDRLPVRVMGAVLNGIDVSRAYKYYSYLPEYVVPQDESERRDQGANSLAPV